MEVTLKDGSIILCEPTAAGHGGAGEVFFVDDGAHVVKFFHRQTPQLEKALELVIGDYRRIVDDPVWAPLYRWPDALVVSPRLGVRLPSIEPTFVELSWLLFLKALARKPAAWRSWRLRLTIASSIAMAVARLHGHGLAHSDLSPRNIWVEPNDGRVTLIDIDGLVVPGVVAPQVVGTDGYMAPEVLAHHAPPSSATDLHSLAVLVYQLLLYRHPLRGPRVASPDPVQHDLIVFGPDGRYVDHPTDHSNRPRDEWTGFWPSRILGPQLVAMFERAFVAGLQAPNERPPAAEWVVALTRLADRVVACGQELCFERYFPVSDGVAPICPWCHRPLALEADLPALHVYQHVGGVHYAPEGNWWLVGNAGRTLHAWHTAERVAANPASSRVASAEVQRGASGWGIQNHALPDLTAIDPVGRASRVAIGQRVSLRPEMKLVLAPPPHGRALVVNHFAR